MRPLSPSPYSRKDDDVSLLNPADGRPGVRHGVLVAYVGCNLGFRRQGGIFPAAKPTPDPVVRPRRLRGRDRHQQKLFADWPKPVAAALISGEQNGYLVPCGCTSGQLGGPPSAVRRS